MAKPRKKQEKVGIDSVSQTNTTAIIVASVGIVALLAAVVAGIFIFGNDDDDAAVTDSVVQFRPVTVTGEPLPPQYSDQEQKQINEATGVQAPDLNGSTFEGDALNIAKDGRGKAITFLAHWCPHCQKEAPLLSDWIAENKDKYPNVDFYGISTAATPTRANYPPSEWLEREDWPTPVMADDNKTSAATAYGLGSYPFMVFLDGENKVVTRTSGELTMTDYATLVQRTQDAVKK